MAKYMKVPLIAGLADQRLDVILDTETCSLRVYWNEYSGYWSLDIYQRNRDVIISGVKLVKNTPLLSRYNLNSPAGDFIFYDNNSGKSRPDFYSLGNDHILIYRNYN
ncbi:phage baseplate plug family protein [Limnobaculum parvum]|uniref:Cyanophage baseplate Pam3 plug gp18 domain-containing protein n=1 Tax=Limnobaculum parvum TaxID=2172103 RepID=A0A2Y9TWU9_9GAMM|nr:hypothetical protein [Limnobaculum parvum]AWH88020.1 hypothetical protein HYN51_05270 [Limnobaculum parvum]